MPTKKLDFKNGQYVVYPTQGVGKLLRIEEQTIGNQKIKLMVIDFERNHMTLRVPLDRAEISGLRPLTSVRKMDEAIQSAKGKAGAKRMIWARRAAQYEENINSGDPMKLAEVVRDLQRRSASDTMTKGNKEVMDKVNKLQAATTEMAQTMCEMAFGTQRIVETGELLSSNARNVRNSVSKISEQIKQFKV